MGQIELLQNNQARLVAITASTLWPLSSQAEPQLSTLGLVTIDNGQWDTEVKTSQVFACCLAATFVALLCAAVRVQPTV